MGQTLSRGTTSPRARQPRAGGRGRPGKDHPRESIRWPRLDRHPVDDRRTGTKMPGGASRRGALSFAWQAATPKARGCRPPPSTRSRRSWPGERRGHSWSSATTGSFASGTPRVTARRNPTVLRRWPRRSSVGCRLASLSPTTGSRWTTPCRVTFRAGRTTRGRRRSRSATWARTRRGCPTRPRPE